MELGETTYIIGLEELQNTVQKIDKKIILVNSSKYTDEAFEYLLDLIDQNETIAFIVDQRQIYTHGEYFGGDLWEDSLNYFSKYVILDNNNEIESQIYATSPKEGLQLKGEGGVYIYSDYDIERDSNTLHIQYQLESAVDKSAMVRVDDKYITLTTHDDKLALDYYDGVSIELVKPKTLEYDNGNTEVLIFMYVTHSEQLKKLNVSASGNAVPMYNIDTGNITMLVFNNVNTILYVDYGDEYMNRTATTTQDWGYAYAYGTNTITSTTFDSMKSTEFENKFNEKTIEIDIPENSFGWFAYPANVELQFVDIDNGLVGGWTKYGQFSRYESNIQYQVYRTENTGLGKTKWRIVKK